MILLQRALPLAKMVVSYGFKKHLLLLSLASVLIVACFVLAFFERVSLYTILAFYSADDSFYYTEVARRFWEDGSISFDGVNVTNGFHPLWMFLQSPIFGLPLDKEQAVFAVKTLEFLLLGVAPIAFLASRPSWPISIFAIPIVIVLMSMRHLYLGLEAATTIAAVFFSIYAYSRFLNEKTIRTSALLVISSILVFTSRFEFLGFVVAAITLLYLDEFIKQAKANYRHLNRVALGFGLFLLAYALFAHFVLGGFVPVSGKIKSTIFSGSQSGEVLNNLSTLLTDKRYYWGIVLSTVALSIMFIERLLVWLKKPEQYKFDALDYVMFGLAALSFVRPLYFAQTVRPIFAKYGWYLTQYDLLILLIAPFVLLKVLRLCHKVNLPKQTLIKSGVQVAAILIASHLAWSGYNAAKLTLKPKTDPVVAEWEVASYHMAMALNEALSDRQEYPLIASSDSGVLGYFYDGPVFNVDGLINSTKFFKARLKGEGMRFLMENGPEYYVNANYTPNASNGVSVAEGSLSRGKYPQQIDPIDTSVVVKDVFAFPYSRRVRAYEVYTLEPRVENGASARITTDKFWEGAVVSEESWYTLYRIGRTFRLEVRECTNTTTASVKSQVFEAKNHRLEVVSERSLDFPNGTLLNKDKCLYDWHIPLNKASSAKIVLNIENGTNSISDLVYSFRL
ncbi:MAG: hypothetical protein ABJH52_13525 [Henriciella sp.]